jgi:hypothetical protein
VVNHNQTRDRKQGFGLNGCDHFEQHVDAGDSLEDRRTRLSEKEVHIRREGSEERRVLVINQNPHVHNEHRKDHSSDNCDMPAEDVIFHVSVWYRNVQETEHGDKQGYEINGYGVRVGCQLDFQLVGEPFGDVGDVVEGGELGDRAKIPRLCMMQGEEEKHGQPYNEGK